MRWRGERNWGGRVGPRRGVGSNAAIQAHGQGPGGQKATPPQTHPARGRVAQFQSVPHGGPSTRDLLVWHGEEKEGNPSKGAFP